MKSLSKYLAGAIFGAVTAIALSAAAVIGTPPGTGMALVDGTWLQGLANGNNRSYQYGIVAKAGGTQSPATLLPADIALVQVDTVASNDDSVALPFCLQGKQFLLRNAGASTLDVYGRVSNNPATGSPDTINGTAGSTPVTMATNTAKSFFCAKNGAWSAN